MGNSETEHKPPQKNLITRDWLAVERTRLANERTFLAYLRTVIAFLAAGVTILKIEEFHDFIVLGYVLSLLSPLLLLFGLYRLYQSSKVIKKYY